MTLELLGISTVAAPRLLIAQVWDRKALQTMSARGLTNSKAPSAGYLNYRASGSLNGWDEGDTASSHVQTGVFVAHMTMNLQ